LEFPYQRDGHNGLTGPGRRDQEGTPCEGVPNLINGATLVGAELH